MEHSRRLESFGGTRVWIGAGLIMVLSAVSQVLSHSRPLTESTVLAATAIGALGVMAMAALLAPVTTYPRWAHWASAAFLAAWTLATPAIAGTPGAWVEDFQANVWYMPWFVLITAGVLRGSARGACATRGTMAGWMLVASSALFPALILFAGKIARGF